MKIRDRDCIEMTWYGEQFETRPSCRRKQVELTKLQLEKVNGGSFLALVRGRGTMSEMFSKILDCFFLLLSEPSNFNAITRKS